MQTPKSKHVRKGETVIYYTVREPKNRIKIIQRKFNEVL